MKRQLESMRFREAIGADVGSVPRAVVHIGDHPFQKQHVFGDPDGERCWRLLDGYQEPGVAKVDPLYAMPAELIDAIAAHVPELLQPNELAFERGLADLCARSAGAAGIVDGNMVPGWMLRPLPGHKPCYDDAFEMSRQQREQQGGQVQPDLIRQDVARRLDPLVELRQGYIGWLMTNRQYIQERDRMRMARDARRQWRSFTPMPGDGPDPAFGAFLDRWQLSHLDCWDLPVPRLGDFAGVGLPGLATGEVGATMPPVVGLPRGYPWADIFEEQVRERAPAHLAGWVDALYAKRPERGGAGHYRGVFFVHFHLNLVVGPRYGDRIGRRRGRLDEAIAEAFGSSPEWVRKAKATIARRLAGGEPHERQGSR